MDKLKVVDIKLKIVRGRVGPAEKRFPYSTLIEYFYKEQEKQKKITMGISPTTYFFLKEVLREELGDLDRVITHSIRVDPRKFLRHLLIQNNLLRISLNTILAETIDEVIIDCIESVGQGGFHFSASILLRNGQRIPKVIPSDALVIALLAGKEIYILSSVIEEKQKIDKEFEEKTTKKSNEPTGKKPKVPRNIYT